MREQTAHPGAGFPVLFEIIDALHELPGLAEKPEILALSFHRFPMHAFQLRLVIEGIQMADTTRAKDLNHAFRFRREMRLAL